MSKFNVLVVSKTTCYGEMVERNDREGLRLVQENHPSVAGVFETHNQHLATVALVEEELRKQGATVTSILRQSFKGQIPSNFKFLTTVGGDGSYIDVTHYIEDDTPVLAVNSAPKSSHGHFCLAGPRNFGTVLSDVIAGRRKPIPLTRMELVLNGEVLPTLVTNEVLICDRDPAATCRYTLEVDGKKERQRSSGLLVGTACGSTGFLRSAGGVIQPVTDSRLQYMPREAFCDALARPDLPGGLAQGEVKVISGMPDGIICADGKYIKYAFPRGSELVLRRSSRPVMAYVDPGCHDRYMKRMSPLKRFAQWILER